MASSCYGSFGACKFLMRDHLEKEKQNSPSIKDVHPYYVLTKNRFELKENPMNPPDPENPVVFPEPCHCPYCSQHDNKELMKIAPYYPFVTEIDTDIGSDPNEIDEMKAYRLDYLSSLRKSNYTDGKKDQPTPPEIDQMPYMPQDPAKFYLDTADLPTDPIGRHPSMQDKKWSTLRQMQPTRCMYQRLRPKDWSEGPNAPPKPMAQVSQSASLHLSTMTRYVEDMSKTNPGLL